MACCITSIVCIQLILTKQSIKKHRSHKLNLKKVTLSSLTVMTRKSRSTSPKMKKNPKCWSKNSQRQKRLTRPSNKMKYRNSRIPPTSTPMTIIITKRYPWLRKWRKKRKNEMLNKKPNLTNHSLSNLIKQMNRNLAQNNKFSNLKIPTHLTKAKIISNQFMTTWMRSNKMRRS